MPSVNLDHLRQFTFGDTELEAEVLDLFVVNGEKYLSILQNEKDEQAAHIAAHSLKGSARGIGAREVERLAEQFEAGAFDCLPELLRAFAEARQFIYDHLALSGKAGG